LVFFAAPQRKFKSKMNAAAIAMSHSTEMRLTRSQFIAACLMFAATPAALAAVPASARSEAAVTRVRPRLEADLTKRGLKIGAPVFIRIFKEPAILELWLQKDANSPKFERFKTYPICKFSGTIGPKLKEGDNQAPEGIYRVDPSQMNPNSRFHLSFNLGYPNEFDRHHRRTGSALMVHGNCVSIGCFAMGDEAIEEIWTLSSAALEAGQKSFAVHIFPFPLRETKLNRHATSPWISFWRDLQPLYEAFESTSVPPEVTITSGRYTLPR
jgi:murein L,D-transpeptidase YafK